MTNELLLSFEEAARRLSVSTSTVRRRAKAGIIKAVRIDNMPRITVEELERYVRSLESNVDAE